MPAAREATAERPALRGTLHLCAAAAAAAGAVLLILLADSTVGYVGAAVFAASLIALYTVSGAYHSISWRPRLRGIVRRLDHAMIFLLIAGTYTPFCLAVMNTAWGISLLSVVWGLAGAGIVLKLAWPGAPRWLSVGFYAGVGWLALIAAPVLVQWLPPLPLALLAGGGVLYTAGGIVYATRRPDPYPRVFGYHEVFHVFVVAGSAVHYALIAAYVL